MEQSIEKCELVLSERDTERVISVLHGVFTRCRADHKFRVPLLEARVRMMASEKSTTPASTTSSSEPQNQVGSIYILGSAVFEEPLQKLFTSYQSVLLVEKKRSISLPIFLCVRSLILYQLQRYVLHIYVRMYYFVDIMV